MKKPTPEQIKAARKKAGLTQTQAANLIHFDRQQQWARWEMSADSEYGSSMHPALFEYFKLMAGVHEALEIKNKRKKIDEK